MHYVIAVDIGTQGTKAALYDEQMSVKGTAFCESNLIMPDSGGVWQDAEEIFQSVLVSIRRLVSETDVPANRIEGIGLDSQMAGIMGVDSECQAVTYYDSWLDTRCGEYVQYMEDAAGEKVTQITGSPVSYAHGPKILWWKHQHPDIYEKVYKFVLPHAYVAGRITGLKGEEIYTDYTCLQYSGFGDNKEKKWSGELLDLFRVERSKMPRILSPFEIIGKLNKEAADFCGLREGTPVVAGAGDTAASVFGAGMFCPGTILDCAGTASVLCSVVEEYCPDLENRTMTMMRSPVDGLWYPLAYINGGGLCIRWFRDLFRDTSYEELEKEAAKVDADSDGLIFVPHFDGRVLPNNPYVRGSFTGLNWKHGRGHMYRAVLEGIAYEYRYYQKILEKLYPQYTFDKIWAIGGGSKSDLFLKIKSEVMNADISAFEMGDTALTGSAVIAGTAVGMITDYRRLLEKKRQMRREYYADGRNLEKYMAMSGKYLKVMEQLTPVYRENV